MNNLHDFWQQLLNAVQAGERCVLMCVVESIGSSPGRTGFKMFVSSTGSMHGSIGGGGMEHKLVELARSLMDRPEKFPFLKRQVHQAGIGQDRSGMICSGEQTVAFYHVHPVHLRALVDMGGASRTEGATLRFDHLGLAVEEDARLLPLGFQQISPTEWIYRERISNKPRIAIIGGGHVGLALARTMNQLGFRVRVFDHRDELNTMTANEWAHERHVVEFTRIEEAVPDDPDLFIALVSHGYRTDELALRQLIRRRWKYLGMLGSQAKVGTMWAKLRADGFTNEELARVHAPIGLPIHSRTPEEIAVSIAAEIISVKNRRS